MSDDQLIATVRLPWGEMIDILVRADTNEPYLRRPSLYHPAPGTP